MSIGLEFATRSPHVLIVDDDRRSRQLLEAMLTSEGLVLQTAEGGEQAVAMVEREAPDLILLDVMMPGMDGYQLAALIKGDAGTQNIPVIIITALDDRDAKVRGLQAGAEDFLTKPVDRSELCMRVRNLLRLKAYGDYYDDYSQRLEGAVASRTADLAERTQQAAGLADQARFKDEFLSHVSHELRSPLTAIKQFTTILLGDWPAI